jgi:uncharacterized protein YprB with RNaseH-like and TPR domain
MLSRTFIHLPGVGQATERKLWKAGVASWQDYLSREELLPAARRGLVARGLAASEERLAAGDAEWFADNLPAAESWRLASHFMARAAYVDIETTGLGETSHITAIALYDGERARTYVHGVNLEAFADDIRAFDLLVTFNGRCFDAPIIERELQIRLPRAHVDLRHVLKSVGLRGGLKSCEKQLRLDREELDGVDGYFAVLLWHEYETTGDPAALETLLAYNVADVLSLPHLLVHAYNEKLAATPFAAARLPEPAPGENPHTADPALIGRLKARYGLYGR